MRGEYPLIYCHHMRKGSILFKHQVTKTYCLLIEAQLHSPLTSALHGPRDWLQASAALLPAQRGQEYMWPKLKVVTLLC